MKLHYREDYKPSPENFKENKKLTSEGQALSLSAMMLQARNGIPIQTTSRQVESYYRNLDLVDASNLSDKYKELSDKIKKNEANYKTHLENLKKSKEEEYQKMIEFYEKSQNEAK